MEELENSIIEKINMYDGKHIPDFIFHYTTIFSLDSIIKSKEFILSSSNNVNDKFDIWTSNFWSFTYNANEIIDIPDDIYQWFAYSQFDGVLLKFNTNNLIKELNNSMKEKYPKMYYIIYLTQEEFDWAKKTTNPTIRENIYRFKLIQWSHDNEIRVDLPGYKKIIFPFKSLEEIIISPYWKSKNGIIKKGIKLKMEKINKKTKVKNSKMEGINIRRKYEI